MVQQYHFHYFIFDTIEMLRWTMVVAFIFLHFASSFSSFTLLFQMSSILSGEMDGLRFPLVGEFVTLLPDK